MVLPAWAWLLVVWAFLSATLTAGLARWFRFLREDDDPRREWHG